MTDWFLIVVSLGCSIMAYWLGRQDGYARGYSAGRKAGSASAWDTFKQAMTGAIERIKE